MTAIIIDKTNSRRRVRTVDQSAQIDRAIKTAAEKGVAVKCTHGGGVANAYKYPATTQACGTVAIRHNGVDYVYSEATQIEANKVTLGGASAATLRTRLYDNRYNEKSQEEMKSKLLCRVAAMLGCWD